MECGEIDLATVLADQSKDGFRPNLNYVRVYWEQVLIFDLFHAFYT